MAGKVLPKETGTRRVVGLGVVLMRCFWRQSRWSALWVLRASRTVGASNAAASQVPR